MQHRLVVIGSKDEFVELVSEAKRRGIYTIVCDGYEDGPAKKNADKAYTIDIRREKEVAQMCIEEKVDGIIGSFSDLIFEQITKIATLAGIKWYATPDMIPFYREKNRTKAVLQEVGVRVPKNRRICREFSESELDGFRFPVVIKPVNGYGSKGIFVVQSVDEIRAYFDRVQERSTLQEILVEEYSQGKEYNMMNWVCDGTVYPISLANREKNCQKGDRIPLLNRLVYPAADVETILPKALDVLQRFVGATGQKDGPISMQFFYNENGVEVCEIAGRFFGYEHKIVTHCSGFSMEKLLIDYVYEPEKIKNSLKQHSPYFERCCTAFYFVGEQGKQIADLSVCKKLAEDYRVIEAMIYYKEGEVIDNFGPNPYLARYYVLTPGRREDIALTRYFFDTMRVEATDGTRVDVPFEIV